MRRLILGGALLLMASPLLVPQAAAARAHLACPVIVSHKGAGDLAPENTAAGIHMAHDEQNATVSEIDIRFNKSNFAWGMHNADLAINTDGTGLITDKWMGEMGSVSYADYPPWATDPAWSGYLSPGVPRTKIPYSYEILQAAKQEGIKLLLDVKVTPTQVQADSLVDDYMDRPELDMRSQVYWMANSVTGLTTMRAWYPDLEYWLLETPTATYVGRTGEYLQSIGATTYVIPYQNVTPGLVAYYHAYSIKVATWGTTWVGGDVAAVWLTHRQAGVDYIITDHGAAAGAAQAEDCTAPEPTASATATPIG